MTENEIKRNLQELVDLTLSGKSLDAFDKFYAEDLEKTDLDGKLVKGKAANRRLGEILISKITALRTFTCPGIIVSGNRSFVAWHVDYDHADLGPIHAHEIAIQDWENGKIVREVFVS